MTRPVIRRSSVIRSIAITIGVNALLPVVLYTLLRGLVPDITALVLATVLPMAENVYHIWKKRSMDAFGLLMLGSFVLGALLALVGGSERLVLVRESLVSAVIGCSFLVSLLFRRPLMFHLARRFVSEETVASYERNWAYPYVRYVFRLMTAVWGLVLLTEAAVRTVLAYKLSTVLFLALSPFIFYGFLGAVIVWTVCYRRHARRRMERLRTKSEEFVR